MSSPTALLMLDLQNEMVDPNGLVGGGGLAKVVAEREVLQHAAAALNGAREHNLPVVHVRLGFREDYADVLSVAPRIDKLKAAGAAVVGRWGTEFPDVIAPLENELIVTKQCVNPFFNTILMPWLARHGIRRLVFGGVVTNLVVESTARAADDAGFEVVVLEDCCAAPSEEWHRFSVDNVIPMFGKVSNTKEFLADLG